MASDLKLGLESGTPDGEVDFYVADVVSLSDYWPFGAPLQERQFTSQRYRYGFQRQEHDAEVMGEGNAVSFKYRVHDARLGRFLSLDPLAAEYPWNSGYAFAENRVSNAIEYEGLIPLSAYVRKTYPLVAAWLDEYSSSMADNDIIVKSFARISRIQDTEVIRRVLRAKNIEEISDISGGVIVDEGYSDINGFIEARGKSALPKDYPWESPPNSDISHALTVPYEKYPGRGKRTGESWSEIYIHDSYFREMEQLLSEGQEIGDINFAAKKLHFMKLLGHEYVHFFQIHSKRTVVSDNLDWDNGAEWEVRYSPFGFSMVYGRDRKGFNGSVAYLDGKFKATPHLVGFTFSSEEFRKLLRDILKGKEALYYSNDNRIENE